MSSFHLVASVINWFWSEQEGFTLLQCTRHPWSKIFWPFLSCYFEMRHANSFKMKTIWDDWTSLVSDKQDGQTKIDRWCLQYTHTDSFQRKKFTVHCDYETVPQFTTISGNLWLNLTLSHFLEKITMSLIQPSSPTQIGQLYFYDQVPNYWKWLWRTWGKSK